MIFGAAMVAVVFTWAVAPALTGAGHFYVLGAVHAALIAIPLHLLNTAFLVSEQTAMRHLRGVQGEINTRDELGRARRRRLIWRSVDSITFKVGDVDHLAITRRGGLIAIDSKWRNDITRAEVAEMASSARRSGLRAEALARQLLTGERGSHRARTTSFSVTSAVVVWGAAQKGMDGEKAVDGVVFVPGSRLLPWLRSLDGDPVTRAAASDLYRRLTTFRARAWEGSTAISAPRQTQPGTPRSATRARAATSRR